MTWLTWRQTRAQVVLLAAALAVLVFVFASSGFGLFDLYSSNKAAFIERLQLDKWRSRIYVLGLISLYVTPPLVGAFLGGPLIARELEAGTHRLVWTQGTTRTRWLMTKLGLTGVVGLVVAGLLSLAVTWWFSPIDQSVADGHGDGSFTLARISPLAFGARGVVPVGYTALGLVIGVTAGLLLRRSVAAIGLTLALTVAAQIAVPLVVRAHLVSPETSTVAITPDRFDGIQIRGGGPARFDATSQPSELPGGSLVVEAASPGDWLLSSATVDAVGHTDLTLPGWVLDCRGAPGTSGTSGGAQQLSSDQACFERLAAEGYRQEISSHPASHFWPLQFRETGLLLWSALLLTAFCFWRIRRDLS